MLTQDLKMSLLISLSLFPVIVHHGLTVLLVRFEDCFRKWMNRKGNLTTVLQENLTGIRVVRAFGRGDFEIEKFLERNGDFRRLEYELFKVLSVYWSFSDFLVFTQLGSGI